MCIKRFMASITAIPYSCISNNSSQLSRKMTLYSSKATLLFFVLITSLHDGMSLGESGNGDLVDCDNLSTCIFTSTPTESSSVSTSSSLPDTHESSTMPPSSDTVSESIMLPPPRMSITPTSATSRTTEIMTTRTQTVASTSRAVTTTITATTVAEDIQSSDTTKVTDATSTDMSNGGGSDGGNPSRIPVEKLASAIGVASVVLLILIVILCGLICCYHMFK